MCIAKMSGVRCWTRPQRKTLSFMDAVLNGIFTVPGDGCIDFLPLLLRLFSHGYDGWLVVEAEQDPRKAHPLTYARLGHDNLRAMAVAAGFDVADPPSGRVNACVPPSSAPAALPGCMCG